MRPPSICVVGMACEYADARSPSELFENVLARRRAFRRIPDERLPLDEYGSDDPGDVDRTTVRHAALIEGWSFDRARFRIVGSTFRAADPTHWLALDVADRALADAGFAGGEGLPRERTGVVLGNTLTGEFSRAQALRLRWPYVRDVLEEVLEGSVGEGLEALLARAEERFKAPFEPFGDESLAGGLANTIAGRICGFYDLGGGGFTVDGACSSSLLAVSQSCSALAAGDLDVALAGGVDLSLDPFELVGFARTGALARDEMRVYDRRAEGFWPGEGCGVLVLMREQDARDQGRTPLARIAGWGVASDGAGGISRPEVEGQLRALRRAYARAGFGPESVGYFEGHGTGTVVGDATELDALTALLSAAGVRSEAAAPIGSIKANIGHTKAAAGVAGAINAIQALRHGLLPPSPACEQPQERVDPHRGALLRVPRAGEAWPVDRPRRAGVSSFGFGGIDVHLVLEAADGDAAAPAPGLRQQRLVASARDTELFVLGADSPEELAADVVALSQEAPRLSRAELGDLAAALAERAALRPGAPVRAALVAAQPEALGRGLRRLAALLCDPRTGGEDAPALEIDPRRGVFLGRRRGAGRIGLLFPGQAAPVRAELGTVGAYSPPRDALLSLRQEVLVASREKGTEPVDTAVAQPAIVAESLLAARALERLGVRASAALGHSVGELGALAWAGALDDLDAVQLAATRGRIMSERGGADGAMAGLAASPAETEALIGDERVVLAARNAPRRCVVSGDAAGVERVMTRAAARGVAAARLAVSHAFHSPQMEACREPLARALTELELRRPEGRVFSSRTGAALAIDADLAAHLVEQLTEPVRFEAALTQASASLDLFVELGPGQMLSALASESVDVPVVALDAGHPGSLGLHATLASAWVAGAPVDWKALYAQRCPKPYDLDRSRRFLGSPCSPLSARRLEVEPAAGSPTAPVRTETTALEALRERVARRCELPVAAIRDEDRFLSDLHLTSIAVSELASSVSRALDRPPLVAPSEFADATLAELAEAIESEAREAVSGEVVAGVDAWVRAFAVREVEREAPTPAAQRASATGTPRWRGFALPGDRLADALCRALEREVGGEGVVLHLPAGTADEAGRIDRLLSATQAAFEGLSARRFVLVHHGDPAVAVARCLHQEARSLQTRVVEVTQELGEDAVRARVLREVRAAGAYLECRYDGSGRRFERRLVPLPEAGDGGPGAVALACDDVVLVTGGGKGIAAECARALALEHGCALALVGRSEPRDDAVLCEQLAGLEAAGIRFAYAAADVVDPDALGGAVDALQARLGPVTAVVHGAGLNLPRSLSALERADFEAALAPKVEGLLGLLGRLDAARLRLVVAFGSAVAQIGLPGEAHYAYANERMARCLAEWGRAHPHTRCLCLDWSIWSGIGMGERLGRVEILAARNIAAITPEEGIAWLDRLLRRGGDPGRIFLAGRIGSPPTLAPVQRELALGRFLEQVREHTPGVELVADALLSHERDPYLPEHVYRGAALLPGAVGLEAMGQIAGALAGRAAPVTLESVEFSQPVTVPAGERVRIRVAGLVRGPGRVEVALRCESTRFAVDHMRAVFAPGPPAGADPAPQRSAATPPQLPCARPLYGRLFFQAGRFARVLGYEALHWNGCRARLDAREERFFGPFEPQGLALGDPGVRDAAIHALQACVPDRDLLPTGVGRIEILRVPGPGPRRLDARERSRSGGTYVYDLDVRDEATGELLERWRGLVLHDVAEREPGGAWPPALVVPLVEEIAGAVLPDCGLRLAGIAGGDRRAGGEAVSLALGHRTPLRHRPDGRPRVDEDIAVSVSHGAGGTWAVAGTGRLACDVEEVEERRPERWRDLLGAARLGVAETVAERCHEPLSVAATRLWGAGECIRKAGLQREVPVVLTTSPDARAVRLQVGPATLMSVSLDVEGSEGAVVFSVLS